jgi:shikimate dehydrogenase
MQNAAFAWHGIDAVYELRPIGSDEVEPFFTEVRSPQWLGFGVTAPYKQRALNHLDEIEADARAIGAVNNGLRRDDGSLVGFNTDASGFASAVESMRVDVGGRKAVVVGAGGAARAVVWALLDMGAASVVVANRSPQRARDLAVSLGRFGNIVPCSLDDSVLDSAFESTAIAVNATTVGMTNDDVAFDVDRLGADALVFDLVYVPPDTALVQSARARGLNVCNGLEMLVRQGEVAFHRWTGIESVADVMRAALQDWLKHPEHDD